MKRTLLALLATAVAALVITGCKPKQEKSDVYTPKKTEPMELVKFETIKLDKPDTESGDALMKVMLNRRSDRDFQTTNLSLKHLSDILWAANGINRPDEHRTVPSAMARYPLKTYAVLANGIYLYDNVAHELVPVAEGDHRELSGVQEFVKDVPLNLVFIADYSVYGENIPEDMRLYLSALDAGHCTQNVYLYCASEGLKTVVRGRAQDETRRIKNHPKLRNQNNFI